MSPCAIRAVALCIPCLAISGLGRRTLSQREQHADDVRTPVVLQKMKGASAQVGVSNVLKPLAGLLMVSDHPAGWLPTMEHGRPCARSARRALHSEMLFNADGATRREEMTRAAAKQEAEKGNKEWAKIVKDKKLRLKIAQDSSHHAMRPKKGRGFATSASPVEESSLDEELDEERRISNFVRWADTKGLKPLKEVAIEDFEFGRGVGAKEDVQAGERIMKIPSIAVIQVNTESKVPEAWTERTWRAARWDAQLAWKLLEEVCNENSPLKPWLDVLPRTFTTPAADPKMREALNGINYPSIVQSVQKQLGEWKKTRKTVPGKPSAEDWAWAMSVVRSRSFQGPYQPGTFLASVLQLFATSTACLAYAVIVGGAGATEFATRFLQFSFLYTVLSELFFMPRFTRSTRYFMCPWLDMFNHDKKQGESLTAYNYFFDSFELYTDKNNGDAVAGQELKISYGKRTNDQLLQYYGFVEENNPYDTYKLSPKDFIDCAREAMGFDEKNVLAAKSSIPSNTTDLTLKPDGSSDANAMRLARLLTDPELAKEANDGQDALPDPAAEALAFKTLVAAAVIAEKRLPEVEEMKTDTVVEKILAQFVAEKRRVLREFGSAAFAAGPARPEDDSQDKSVPLMELLR